MEGLTNMLKSGYHNPVSTFFSNVLIIEGPRKLKEELFAAFYEYIDSTADLNNIMKELVDVLILKTFGAEEFPQKEKNFILEKSTTLTMFLYDIVIVYAENNDVYLSSYDFVQPDATMVNSSKFMDPVYISNNFKDALEKDLEKFKKIKSDYEITGASTIYHKAYKNYVEKNISILCKFFYSKDEC